MRTFPLHKWLALLVASSILSACGDNEDPSSPNTSLEKDQGPVIISQDMGSQGQADMSASPVWDMSASDMATFDPEDFGQPSADMAALIPGGLVASHQIVEFAHAIPGYTQTRHITLRNEGDGSVTIPPLRMARGLDTAGWELDWVKPGAGSTSAIDSSLELAAGEHSWLRLRHTSTLLEADETMNTLTLSTLERPEEVIQIEVVAGVDAPCLDVKLPPAPSFHGNAYIAELGRLDMQDVIPRGFSLINCGALHPVHVSDTYISRNPYDLLALPALRDTTEGDDLPLLPQEARFIEVEVLETEEPIQLEPPYHVGQVTSISDAVGFEVFDVTLRAAAEDSTCPRADVRVAPIDEMAPAVLDTIQVEPLDVVRLDALMNNASTPASNQSVAWSLLSKPATSHTVLSASSARQENQAALTRELFLDVPGEYIVELQTFAPGESSPCQTDQVVIIAEPTQDIYVSTTWETPLDPDPGDRVGTDIDLHYLHPQGSFEDEVYDVFWRNRNADWGYPGGLDDPALLRDDRDGHGPEVVAHEGPEQGKSYRIGVHYFDPAGFGSSYVSTTIHIQGQLAATSASQLLPSKGSYLRVGTIAWSTSPQVTIENTLLLSPPE